MSNAKRRRFAMATARAHLPPWMALVCLVSIGCNTIWGKEFNREVYCPTHPDDPGCAPPDANTCSSSAMCSAPTGVCDLAGTMTCVQCTQDEPAACTGTTPACVDHTCQRCTAHAQCATSNVCLPDGSCADTAQVAYVDPNGTDTPECSKASPCTKVTSALSTNRPYVKFHDTTDEAVAIGGGRVVTFLADPGAKLTRSSVTGAIVTVQDNGTSLSVYDLSISNAPNSPAGIGCVIPAGSAATLSLTRVKLTNNPGGGISVDGGTLTVSQSEISDNIAFGIRMISAGIITLTNNFLHHNGNDSSAPFGALLLRPAPGSMVQFNTIADNKATLGAASAGGVFCDVADFVAGNNLIFRNTGGPTGMIQTFGICTYGSSFVTAAPVADNTPQFAHPNTPPFDYRLTAGTPATIRDAAGPCSILDFDGEARPSGAACDLGADEYHP